MKYLLSFWVGILLVNCEQAYIYEGHKHTKAEQDRATAVNGANTGNVSQVNEYKLSANESIYINYNEALCYYGIWNLEKRLALLYASKDNLVGVYNTSSTSLLVVSTRSNHVTLRLNTPIEFTISTLPQAFSAMYGFMIESRTNNADNGTLSVDISLNGLLDINPQNPCQENCDFFKCLRNSFGGYLNELIIDFSNGIRGFGSLFTPLLSTARYVAAGFFKFFGAAIRGGIKLQRNLIQAFGLAVGRGFQFINTNLIGQLVNAIRATGTFFSNITQGLTQVFTGGGISNFNSSTIKEGNKNTTISSLITGDNSWLVRIGNNSVKLLVSYNAKQNLFGFYNRGLDISVVFDGNTGFYEVVNTTSGVGLVISQSTGNARVVADRTGQIHNAFEGQQNFTKGFILIGQSIESSSGGLNNLINLDSDVINFRLVVILLEFGLNIDMAFLGKDQVSPIVKRNFGRLFDAAHEYFQRSNSGFDLALGPLNILFPILHLGAFTNNFIPIIRNIFANLGGLFNPALMIRIGTAFANNLSSGVNNLILEALNFALSTAKNFSGGINSIIGGILNEIPEAEIDIKFGRRNCSCNNSSNGNS